MFTSNPPLPDDLRILADLLWRYAKISSNFVFIGSPRLRITESTTIIQKSITSRFNYKIFPPNDSALLIASKSFTDAKPLKTAFDTAETAGGELRKMNNKKYKISNSEKFLFSTPFSSDFTVNVQRIQAWDDEILGVKEERIGSIKVVTGSYCNFEVSGGVQVKNNERNNFIEVVLLAKEFEKFGEIQCKIAAEEYLALVKKLIGENVE